MSYFKPQILTPFHKKKIQEVSRCDREGINPLTVMVFDGGEGHKYSTDDVRNYYESINKPYTLIL